MPTVWWNCNSLSQQVKSIRDKGTNMDYIYGMQSDVLAREGE